MGNCCPIILVPIIIANFDYKTVFRSVFRNIGKRWRHTDSQRRLYSGGIPNTPIATSGIIEIYSKFRRPCFTISNIYIQKDIFSQTTTNNSNPCSQCRINRFGNEHRHRQRRSVIVVYDSRIIYYPIQNFIIYLWLRYIRFCAII